MSLQVRVLIELAPSETEAASARLEQVETIMPAHVDSEDFSDVLALGIAALERMTQEVHDKAAEQLEQYCTLLERAHEA